MTKDVERFTFRIPARLLNLIKKEAQEKGISVNALILQILWEWADKKTEFADSDSELYIRNLIKEKE